MGSRSCGGRGNSTHHCLAESKPSRRASWSESGPSEEDVFVGESAFSENIPATTQRHEERLLIQGGRERGLVIHKLLEEVLTGETEQDLDILELRARSCFANLVLPKRSAPKTVRTRLNLRRL